MVVVSLFVGVVLVELICHIVMPSLGQPVYEWNRRIMFFDGPGSIFENHDHVFTYVPHADIHSLTVYYSGRGFDIEYDYRFHTNNFGLVQDADIAPQRPSLLLLGDSFTEGQGAPPWFRQFAAANEKLPYQLINGGLQATGFAQWQLLDRYLAKADINAKKVLVLFISDDYTRAPGIVSPAVLACLTSVAAHCPDDAMYRLPPAQDIPQRVDEIRTQRDGGLAHRLLQRAGNLLPVTHQVYLYLKAKFSSAADAARPGSRAAIAALISEHGAGNIAFLHLPQKDELAGPNRIGRETRKAIADAGGKLYDGFQLCKLTPADYHVHDGHPNQQGYDKIAHCVTDVIGDMLGATQQTEREGLASH